MKHVFLFAVVVFSMFSSQNAFSKKKKGGTLGDPSYANWSGYQPLDPFQVNLFLQRIDSNGKRIVIPDKDGKLIFDQTLTYINNAWTDSILHEAVDETVRSSIRDISENTSASVSAIAKGGYKGHRFELTMDITKTVTTPLSFAYAIEADSTYTIYPSFTKDTIAGKKLRYATLPVYVGIGARMTASFTTNEENISANFAVLGFQGDAKQVTGDIVIQTLGMSDETIPFSTPSEINASTIQNELIALGAIKTKIHDSRVAKRPRIVGFYNAVGGGKQFVMAFISFMQLYPPTITLTYPPKIPSSVK